MYTIYHVYILCSGPSLKGHSKEDVPLERTQILGNKHHKCTQCSLLRKDTSLIMAVLFGRKVVRFRGGLLYIHHRTYMYQIYILHVDRDGMECRHLKITHGWSQHFFINMSEVVLKQTEFALYTKDIPVLVLLLIYPRWCKRRLLLPIANFPVGEFPGDRHCKLYKHFYQVTGFRDSSPEFPTYIVTWGKKPLKNLLCHY